MTFHHLLAAHPAGLRRRAIRLDSAVRRHHPAPPRHARADRRHCGHARPRGRVGDVGIVAVRVRLPGGQRAAAARGGCAKACYALVGGFAPSPPLRGTRVGVRGKKLAPGLSFLKTDRQTDRQTHPDPLPLMRPFQNWSEPRPGVGDLTPRPPLRSREGVNPHRVERLRHGRKSAKPGHPLSASERGPGLTGVVLSLWLGVVWFFGFPPPAVGEG